MRTRGTANSNKKLEALRKKCSMPFLPTNKVRQKVTKTSYKRIVISFERIYNNTEPLYTKNSEGL